MTNNVDTRTGRDVFQTQPRRNRSRGIQFQGPETPDLHRSTDRQSQHAHRSGFRTEIQSPLPEGSAGTTRRDLLRTDEAGGRRAPASWRGSSPVNSTRSE